MERPRTQINAAEEKQSGQVAKHGAALESAESRAESAQRDADDSARQIAAMVKERDILVERVEYLECENADDDLSEMRSKMRRIPNRLMAALWDTASNGCADTDLAPADTTILENAGMLKNLAAERNIAGRVWYLSDLAEEAFRDSSLSQQIELGAGAFRRQKRKEMLDEIEEDFRNLSFN